MTEKKRNETIKAEVKLFKKEILYIKGKKRLRAKRAYFKLLATRGRSCRLNDPIHLKRNS